MFPLFLDISYSWITNMFVDKLWACQLVNAAFFRHPLRNLEDLQNSIPGSISLPLTCIWPAARCVDLFFLEFCIGRKALKSFDANKCPAVPFIVPHSHQESSSVSFYLIVPIQWKWCPDVSVLVHLT